MTTFGKGSRSRTRHKLKAEKRHKFTVESRIQNFKEGQKVSIKQDPSSHGGMPHVRYKGRVAVVKSKRGSAYVLNLRVGSKDKELIAKPEHLKPIKQ
jgi:large subunit ribosomal protein L21e